MRTTARIAILGAGAIGATIAADLTAAGLAPTVFDPWPAQIDALQSRGLALQLPDRVWQSPPMDAHPLSDLASLKRELDVVFIAAKAQDARWLAAFIEPYLAADGVAVGLMNGMMDDDIAEIVGRKRTVGCVVELSVECFEPGRARRKTPRERTWFALGELDGSMTPRLERLRALLSHAGRVDLTANIAGAKWTKLVTNAMVLAPFAMMGAESYDALREPAVLDFVKRIGMEAVAVGQACGYRLEPIFGLTSDEMAGEPAQVVEKLAKTLVGHVGGASRNAVMQDHLKGRRTETRCLNGLVVRKGETAGIPTPANAAIVEVSSRIERSALAPDARNFQLALDTARGRC